MAFPGPKVHRSSRRKLGRGQYTPGTMALISASAATTVVTLNFSNPVIVSGNVPLGLNVSHGLISQAQPTPTQIVQTYNTSVAGLTYNMPGGLIQISTYTGGSNAPASGTF